jgi:hypothetical protein
MSNVSTHLKNFTAYVFYGINSNNESFQVIPEEDPNFSGLVNSDLIYVLSQERIPGQMLPNIYSKKHYRPPLDNIPLYIKEMGCVLFTSDKERFETIEKYGNGEKIIIAYAAGMSPLINASYTAITSLSDKTFYQITEGTIDEIPRESTSYVEELFHKYDISPEKRQTHDIFVINTVIRKGNNKLTRDAIVKTKIVYVEKSTIIPGNPIIFSYNGLVIFNEYKDAESFLIVHGSVDGYMINKGLAVTHRRQERQIEELNRRASTDKKSMVQIFSLMGGTSVLSIFTKTLLQCVEEGESGNETLKRLLKILGIGVIGVGGVIGVYLLYKKYNQYKEETKNAPKRAA